MFCNKCGNRNPLNSHFCRHCGVRLDMPGAATHVSDDAYRIEDAELHHVFDEEKVQRLLDRAFSLSERGDTVGAILACREALAENPESASGHSFLALLYERQGEKERALHEYEKVVELSPDSTVDRENLNRLRGEMQRVSAPDSRRIAAREWLGQSAMGSWYSSPYVRATPVVVAAVVSILLIMLVNHRSTRPVVSASSDENAATGKAVQAYQRKGRAAWMKGDYAEAEKNFKSALLLSPSDSETSYLLARLQEMRSPKQLASAPAAAATANMPPASAPPPPPPRCPSRRLPHLP